MAKRPPRRTGTGAAQRVRRKDRVPAVMEKVRAIAAAYVAAGGTDGRVDAGAAPPAMRAAAPTTRRGSSFQPSRYWESSSSGGTRTHAGSMPVATRDRSARQVRHGFPALCRDVGIGRGAACHRHARTRRRDTPEGRAWCAPAHGPHGTSCGGPVRAVMESSVSASRLAVDRSTQPDARSPGVAQPARARHLPSGQFPQNSKAEFHRFTRAPRH